MTNKFEIQVVALDRATGVFRKVNNSMSQTMRPITRMQKQFGSLAREMHLDKLTKGMGSLSKAGANVAKSLGLAGAPLEALFGLGAAGGIVATVAAVASLGNRFGNLGFEVSRTATAFGVSTNDLQRYRGAATLAGVSAESMTKTIGNLGRTIQDANMGRNDPALITLNALGIGIKRTKDGLVDVKGTLDEISNVMKTTANPQVRQKLADILGIDSESLPLLMQGADAMKLLADKAEKLGLVLGPKQIKDAEDYAAAMRDLGAAATGLQNKLGAAIAPAVTRGMNGMSNAMESGGVWGAIKNVLSGRATWNMVAGGAAAGQQRASGVVTGDVPSAGGLLPRGMRSHNPGNLMNPGGVGFQSFGSDEDGLRAMADQLRRYQNVNGLTTIQGIIGRYASGKYPGNSPATEAGYVDDVSKQTGFAPNQQLDLNDAKTLAPLLSAMSKHEQGKQMLSADQYANAAQPVKVEVAFANAPAGMQAKASSGSTAMPMKVSYAMPLSDAP
jgi:hypothetical protein